MRATSTSLLNKVGIVDASKPHAKSKCVTYMGLPHRETLANIKVSIWTTSIPKQYPYGILQAYRVSTCLNPTSPQHLFEGSVLSTILGLVISIVVLGIRIFQYINKNLAPFHILPNCSAIRTNMILCGCHGTTVETLTSN